MDTFSEKLTLFQSLKIIIEKILSHHSHDVWSVHGGLQSLVQSLDAIFQHGVKPQTGLIGVVIDYWLFVRGLRWLDPTLGSDINNLSKLPAASPVKPLRTNSLHSFTRHRSQLTHGQQWIEKSLMDRNLSKQIATLLSDTNHLQEHYYDWAILFDELYTSAILTCLSALEQNSPALLANIPASLFIRRTRSRSCLRLHRGSSASVNDMTLLDLSENSASAIASPTSSKSRDQPDPLNVGIKPGVMLPRQIKFEHRRKASSFNFDSSRGILEAEPTSGHMGLIQSKAEQRSAKLPENVPLKERLMPRRRSKLASEGDSTDLQTDHKPLFYDSSDDERLPDDLNFLLTPSVLPSRNEQMNLYYSTIDSKINLEETILPSAVSCGTEILVKNNPESTSEQLPASNLPDLVISAEVSRSNRTTPIENEANVKASNFEPIKDNRPLKPLKKVPSLHHRRSKSDQIRGLKLADDEYDNNDVNTLDGPMREEIRPASTFSYVQSPSFCQRPTASTLSRSTSLMNYLKSQDLTTCADIEKENAHFDFSEILIGAIEQMKCQMQRQQRRNEKDRLVALPIQNEDPFPASEGYSSPIGSFMSTSPAPHSTLVSRSGLPLDGDNSFTSTLAENRKISTVSDGSSKSDSLRTAESIAIGLLQSFSDRRRATVNDFDWLISEDDVPQKLLPLPKSTVVDPDFSSDQGIRIRGNQDWAPPRPQIIFIAPIKLKLKFAMAKQNNRCAGCGTYVEKEFMKRFRYCEYTGKYFCTCCHDNKLAVLPANVLQKFDFTKYKVSNFSFDLLMKIANDPLFNIEDINPSLYKKAKHLATVRELRVQMLSLFKYLQLCRFANSATEDHADGLKAAILSSLPSHILTDDPHVYSLTDLERSKSGELIDDLKSAVTFASDHVMSCELCRSKGFLCEICHSDDLLFPHQSIASRCAFCKSCFHRKCFVASSCPKCARLRKRREVLEQISEE